MANDSVEGMQTTEPPPYDSGNDLREKTFRTPQRLQVPSDNRHNRNMPDGTLNIYRLLAAALRQKFIILVAVSIGLILGFTYLLVSVPKYTAEASLLLDSQAQVGVDVNSASGANGTIDAVRVDSQIEVMMSDQMIVSVIASLTPKERQDLTDNMDLSGPSPFKALQRMWHHASQPAMTSAQPPSNDEIDFLRRNGQISRVDRTYVLTVSFTSASAALSARIANLFVTKYVENQNSLHQRSGEQQLAALRERAAAISREIADVPSKIIQLSRDTAAIDDTLVQKRLLQLNADQYQKELDSVLSQQFVVTQQQNVPFFGGQAIVGAAEPSRPSQPRISFVLTVSLALGAAAGAAAAAIIELSDQTLRTAADVADELRLPFLGMLPVISNGRQGTPSINFEEIAEQNEIPESYLYAKRYPLSRYTEALRLTRLRLDLNATTKRCSIIGITSAMPGDGKSTFAANLAFSLGRGEERVLLIDGDIRHMTLTTALAPEATVGLIDAVLDQSTADFSLYLLRADGLNVIFLPAGGRSDSGGSTNLTIANVRQLFEYLSKQFDYIVVDLPPSNVVAASKSLLFSVDHFVLVTKWGKTKIGAVQRMLEMEPHLRSRLLGVVLNMVNLRRLKAYELGRETNTSSYDSYFSDPR